MADSTVVIKEQPKRRRWPRILISVVMVLVALVLTAYFVVTSPPFIKGVVLPRVGDALHANVTVSDVSFSPFRQIVLHDLKVQAKGQAPVMIIPLASVRYQLWDILHGNIHIDDVTLDSPTIKVVENPDGSRNVDPLLKALQQKSAKPAPVKAKPSQAPQVDLGKLTLRNASIVQIRNYADGQSNVLQLTNLNLTLTNLKNGQSAAAQLSVTELDNEISKLVEGFNSAYDSTPVWLAASEYAIVPVNHVTYPNLLLREAGLLAVREEADGEHLNLEASDAWALVDHQFSHIFVRDGEKSIIKQVVDLFRNQTGIAEVLSGENLKTYNLNHPRSGEIVLVSEPNSWQAYYWWLDDARAPTFARTVDIHRKPGYDPVELFFDPATRSIPLDATLVKGSHGAPAKNASQQGVLVSSQAGMFQGTTIADFDVAAIVLSHFAA